MMPISSYLEIMKYHQDVFTVPPLNQDPFWMILDQLQKFDTRMLSLESISQDLLKSNETVTTHFMKHKKLTQQMQSTFIMILDTAVTAKSAKPATSTKNISNIHFQLKISCVYYGIHQTELTSD